MSEQAPMSTSLHCRVAEDSPWPHRLALVTTIATLPLLFVGGLVTSTGAGLAVPDWPTTFGHNMFLFPWSQMVGGIFYEHSHRLLGSLVGVLTVLLSFVLWRTDARPIVRWLGVVALGAVIMQGVLGGLRVVLLQHTLAIIHACFAQAFFALLAVLTVLTSAEWKQETARKPAIDAAKVQRLGLLTAGFIYLQLILGALVRHTGEWVEMHIIGAALVSIHVILLAARVRRSHADQRPLTRSAHYLLSLLILQLVLGFGAYLGKFTESGAFLSPFVIALATSHVVVGALMLVACAVLTLWAYQRLNQSPQDTQPQLVSEHVPV